MGNIRRPIREDSYAVYHDSKFLAPLVILTGYRDGAETDAVLPGIKNGLAGFQLDRQGV